MKKQIFLIKTKSCSISKEDLLEYITLNNHLSQKFDFFLADENFLKKFNDGEISINLTPDEKFLSSAENFDPKNVEETIILTSISGSDSGSINDNLMENLIIIDASKRAGIKKIKLIPLYMGYLRQDRRLHHYKTSSDSLYKQNLEPITSSLIFNLLEKSGVSELILIDPHFIQVEGFAKKMKIEIFGGEFLLGFIFEAILRIFFQNNVNCKNSQEIISFFKKICSIQLEKKFFNSKSNFESLNFLEYQEFFSDFSKFLFSEFQIVAPDAGSLKKLRNYTELIEEIMMIFANKLNYQDLQNKKINVCFIEKLRVSPGASKTMSITNNFENSHCLILDDILDSGSTLVSAANFLKQGGFVKSVSAFITHGICSLNCQEKIENSEIQNMFLTNSISKHQNFNLKFQFFDLRELLKYFINF